MARGEVGIIEVKGRNVFKGYWNMPEKTAQEFRPDGFFITGDLATMDADGYVTIVGRAKDLIISGGYNVYPKEIELLLDEQPGVAESAVVGVPHTRTSAKAWSASSCPRPRTAEEAELIAGIAGRLAPFQQPRRIFVVANCRATLWQGAKNALRERIQGQLRVI